MKKFLFCLVFAPLAFSYTTILKESPELPITTFNITFKVGSAQDPATEKGISDLTAHLMREGGMKKMGSFPALDREELEEILFPLAADISVDAEKEQTSFTVTTTSESAEQVFDLLSQMILSPEFSANELERIKAEVKDSLEKKLPLEDQEELGKAALDRALFGEGHPYAHVGYGNLKSLAQIDVKKIKAFYHNQFTQDKIVVGAGGILSEALKNKLRTVFSTLPLSTNSTTPIPMPKRNEKIQLMIVTGPFDSTGVHIGLPQDYNRASSAFPAMYLTSNAFGKHRSFVGRLMKVVREIRGLNYGTYAYVEDFPDGGKRMIAPTQVARQIQAFTMWGRPTPLHNGCFLFKQMLREFDNLSAKGLAITDFNLGKSHLNGYIPLLATEVSRQLGYAIDSEFYGIKNDFLSSLQKSNEKLTLKSVNATITKNLQKGKPTIVVVTKDADAFLKALKSGNCPIQYGEGITKEKSILKEDEVIAKYPVNIQDSEIKIISSKDLFN